MPYQVEISPGCSKGNRLITNCIQEELTDRESYEINEVSLFISDEVSVYDFSCCPVMNLADCCKYEE